MDAPTGSGDLRPVTIAELERWAEFGARWRARRVSEQEAVVDLCECTGELVERRSCTDPDVIAYVRAHAAEAE